MNWKNEGSREWENHFSTSGRQHIWRQCKGNQQILSEAQSQQASSSPKVPSSTEIRLHLIEFLAKGVPWGNPQTSQAVADYRLLFTNWQQSPTTEGNIYKTIEHGDAESVATYSLHPSCCSIFVHDLLTCRSKVQNAKSAPNPFSTWCTASKIKQWRYGSNQPITDLTLGPLPKMEPKPDCLGD